MCELTHGMAGERHGHGRLCLNRPLGLDLRASGLLYDLRRFVTDPSVRRIPPVFNYENIQVQKDASLTFRHRTSCL